METLPHDALVALLQNLPPRPLLSVAATSKFLHVAAFDETLWHNHCHRLWPTANRGSLLATYRECFRFHNGWACLDRLPRRVIDLAGPLTTRQPTRSTAQPPVVTAFDASDRVIAIASRCNRKGVAPVPALELHSVAEGVPTQRVALPAAAVVSCCELLPADSRLALVFAAKPAGAPVMAFGVRSLEGVSDPVPLWTAERSNPNYIRRALWSAAQPASLLLHVSGSPTHGAYLSSTCELLDLHAQRPTLTIRASTLGSGCSFEVEDVCLPEPSSPHHVVLALRAGRSSALAAVDTRVGPTATLIVPTHHESVWRLGAGRDGMCLTSHSFCKDVEAWDLRGTSGCAAERYHCAGNAPDFDQVSGWYT